ncbi:MAG: sigma 54-interacting transcriptional regulator [Methylococcales bacterium]|nr:sigma 54-interacting transcriptional regulator [Methylococcales bacterium]
MNDAKAQAERWLAAIDPTELLNSLAELSGQPAWVGLDEDGRIMLWSPGAHALTGWAEQQVLGHRPSEFLVNDKASDDRLLHGQHADGHALAVQRHSLPLSDRHGADLGSLERWQQHVSNKPVGAHDSTRFHGILTCDPVMLEALNLIGNVAETEATVLIRGESGTGKELVARALHQESPRHAKPFLAINCAALTPSLLESELFGHVKGAFTGAVRAHDGLFQRADGGTLFLDEVAELPLELQAKLLRVLQEHTFTPVGGDLPVRVNVRIIAATHKALREEVKAGRFREDLMYRLRVVPVFLPPLRERRLDIKLLLWHRIERQNQTGPRRVERIAPDAMQKLLDYRWPGNVRELNNVVEYAFAVGRGAEITLAQLPPEFREAVNAVQAGRYRADSAERERILQTLTETRGDLNHAAKRLGMSRATL